MRLQIRDGRFPRRSDSLKTGLFFGGSRFDVSDLDFFTRFEIVTQRYGDLTPVLALFDGAFEGRFHDPDVFLVVIDQVVDGQRCGQPFFQQRPPEAGADVELSAHTHVAP